jgi:hypothetical protein
MCFFLSYWTLDWAPAKVRSTSPSWSLSWSEIAKNRLMLCSARLCNKLAQGRYSMLRNRMKAFAKGEYSFDIDTSALCVLFNDSPYHHMSACGLGDGPQGACNGQTDNPNGDFNVTIQNMPSNAPSKSKVTKCKLSSTAMSLPSHSPDASGGCIWVFVLSR